MTLPRIAWVTTILLLLSPISMATFGKRREFKPMDVPAEAAMLVKAAAEDHLEKRPGRQIRVRKTGQGLRFNRMEDGLFRISFDLSLQYMGEFPLSSLIPGIEERKTLGARDLKNPTFAWKLDDRTRKEIENMINTPEHGILRSEVRHTEMISGAKGDTVQTGTRVELMVGSAEKAVEIITLYFSKFAEDAVLWEDDG